MKLQNGEKDHFYRDHKQREESGGNVGGGFAKKSVLLFILGHKGGKKAIERIMSLLLKATERGRKGSRKRTIKSETFNWGGEGSRSSLLSSGPVWRGARSK